MLTPTKTESKESLAAKKQSKEEELRQTVAKEVFEMIRASGGTSGMGAKEAVETLRDLDLQCEQAKVAAMDDGEVDPPWVETTETLYKLILRKRLDKAEYQDYHGVKLCLHGQSERLKEKLARQIDAINHPATIDQAGDGKVNQPTSVRAKAGSAVIQ